MAEGSFQNDAFFGGGFAISYSAGFVILEASDQPSFSVGVTTKVTFTITENQDLAAFAAAASTITGFNILEALDTAYFEATANDKVYVEFELLEAMDTASFSTHVRHVIEFDLVEAADVLVADVVSTTYAGFDIFEIPDRAYFRSIAAFFDVGDADFIYVPPQADVISIPPVTDATVAAERQTSLVPDEWQRIDVDETRTWRKD